MKKSKNINRIFVIIYLFYAIFILCTQQSNVDEKRDQTITSVQLFNKISLEGWYTYIKGRGLNNDPKDVFTVQDSFLRVSGEEWGCMTSLQEYDNYHLIIEFKWGAKTFPPRFGKARDSGVLLHSNGANGAYGDSWMYSIECQIIEGGTGDFIVVGDSSKNYSITCNVSNPAGKIPFNFQQDGIPKTIYEGRVNWYGRDPKWLDVIGYRGVKDIENPIGQWNKMECIVYRDEITILLNGILINKAFNVKPSKGRIQIQSEGAEIYFRKIELLPIKESCSNVFSQRK